MTIGERLEEARKRKSVSIREAAEATKIRGDFLIAMESDDFEEVNLPEIYVRGFLKNYAKFLRLDSDNILTDYDARQLAQNKWTGATRHGHTVGNTPPPAMHTRASAPEPRPRTTSPRDPHTPEERNSYGQMEIGKPAEPPPQPEPRPQPATPPPQPKPKHVPTALTPQIPDEADKPDGAVDEDKAGVYKVALLVVMGVFIVGIFIMLIIRVLGGGGDAQAPDINPDLANQPTQSAPVQTAPNAAQAIEPQTFTIRALDNVTVIIEQRNDGQELFRGTLLEGETMELEKVGPAVIRYTNGSALEIQMDGRRFRMPEDGVGTGRLP